MLPTLPRRPSPGVSEPPRRPSPGVSEPPSRPSPGESEPRRSPGESGAPIFLKSRMLPSWPSPGASEPRMATGASGGPLCPTTLPTRPTLLMPQTSPCLGAGASGALPRPMQPTPRCLGEGALPRTTGANDGRLCRMLQMLPTARTPRRPPNPGASERLRPTAENGPPPMTPMTPMAPMTQMALKPPSPGEIGALACLTSPTQPTQPCLDASGLLLTIAVTGGPRCLTLPTPPRRRWWPMRLRLPRSPSPDGSGLILRRTGASGGPDCSTHQRPPSPPSPGASGCQLTTCASCAPHFRTPRRRQSLGGSAPPCPSVSSSRRCHAVDVAAVAAAAAALAFRRAPHAPRQLACESERLFCPVLWRLLLLQPYPSPTPPSPTTTCPQTFDASSQPRQRRRLQRWR